MKVAIVGSRNASYERLQQCHEFVESLPLDTVVVSGGADGVDTEAAETAWTRGMKTEVFLPKWHRPDGSYDRGAGFARNALIVEAADVIVAFWDGKSKGTANTIEQARKAGKRVLINPTQWEPTK